MGMHKEDRDVTCFKKYPKCVTGDELKGGMESHCLVQRVEVLYRFYCNAVLQMSPKVAANVSEFFPSTVAKLTYCGISAYLDHNQYVCFHYRGPLNI